MHAWENRCPHRGMRLSYGFVRENTLTCLYHGWRYDGSGSCVAIPAHPALTPPKTIKVQKFSCEVRNGLIWVAPESISTPAPSVEGSWADCRSVAVNACADTVRDVLTGEKLSILCHEKVAASGDEITQHSAQKLFASLVRLHSTAKDEVLCALQSASPTETFVHVQFFRSSRQGKRHRGSTSAFRQMGKTIAGLHRRRDVCLRQRRSHPTQDGCIDQMSASMNVDPFTESHWYAIGRREDVLEGGSRRTTLLDHDIIAERNGNGADHQFGRTCGEAKGRRALPVQEKYGHVWTTLSESPRPLYSMPEFEEAGRRLVTAGAVTVRCSGLRIVENFLDLAHFPFVHTGVLGEEPHTEVVDYVAEIRTDVDEVWATKCKFYQPKAAATATGGQITDYKYRAPHPFSTILYKTCPILEKAPEGSHRPFRVSSRVMKTCATMHSFVWSSMKPIQTRSSCTFSR